MVLSDQEQSKFWTARFTNCRLLYAVCRTFSL